MDYSNTLVKKCSAGTKRKLNVCIAFIGKPRVLLLDEPTSAIDPQSRRKIWNIITDFKRNVKNNSFIILSSHNFQEIEHLCDK